MLSKEEYEKALEHLIECKQRKLCDKCNFKLRCTMSNDELVINQLIEECFELKEKYKKILDDVHDYRYETHCMKMTIRNLYEHFGVKSEKELQNIYLNKPYNFEDLKVGMWILDRKPQYEEYTFIKIIKILSESDCEYLYHDKDKKIFFDNMECIAREFEENRFFPVQCANLIKMEVKEDG